MTDASELLDPVRRFVRERLVPLESQIEADDKVPDAIVQAMRDMGLFGISIPEAHGGLGLSMSAEIDVIRAFGWTSPAFRSVFGTNVGIGSQAIVMDGTPEQKAQFLPRIAAGDLIASFCLTEPDVGSDAGSVKTRAVRDGDHFILDGVKRYITNAPRAGLFTVMARTGTPEQRGAGVTAFLVDAASPGLSLGKPEKKMGQRGAHVCDVIFEGVRVPADRIVGGKEGQGFKTAMKVLDRGRLHIASLCVGQMDRAIAEGVAFTTGRTQFGQRIAEHQMIQAQLADCEVDRLAAWAMVERTAARLDAGQPIAAEASACKLFASEALGRVADRVVQMHGGAGYIADYAAERIYRDARLFRIYEGTSEIQRLILARDLIRREGGI